MIHWGALAQGIVKADMAILEYCKGKDNYSFVAAWLKSKGVGKLCSVCRLSFESILESYINSSRSKVAPS